MYKFEEILSGDRVDLLSFSSSLKENEEIKKKKVKIKWTMEPCCSRSGIGAWHLILMYFSANIIVINTDTEEEICIQFDNDSHEYDMIINTDQYKMSADFFIHNIEIDRKERKAIGFIG